MRKIIIVCCLCGCILGALCSCDLGHKNKLSVPDTSVKIATSFELGDNAPKSISKLAAGDPVTLGELEDDRAECQGYEGNDSEYTFWYATETRGYAVTVRVSASIKETIDELSIMDDYYDEKWDAIRRELVAVGIEALNDEPISNAELSKYVGQKALDVIMDGFEMNGYYSFVDGYDSGVVGVYVVKNGQEYLLTLEPAAFAAVHSGEYTGDGYKVELLPFKIESVKYSRPCCW